MASSRGAGGASAASSVEPNAAEARAQLLGVLQPLSRSAWAKLRRQLGYKWLPRDASPAEFVKNVTERGLEVAALAAVLRSIERLHIPFHDDDSAADADSNMPKRARMTGLSSSSLSSSSSSGVDTSSAHAAPAALSPSLWLPTPTDCAALPSTCWPPAAASSALACMRGVDRDAASASVLPRPVQPSTPPAVTRMDALYYKSHLYKDWMRRWQAAHPDVLHVILDDIGSMGGKQLDERGSQILVSIAYKTREARVGMRSARSFAEKLLAAVTDAVPFVWVPIGLRAMGDDKHANALWIDLRELYGGDGVVHIWHYEPHGGDAQDRRHDGCGFTNYYNTSTYSASMCEFLHRAVTEGGLPFACVYHAPSSWEPPVFAQSVSDVKGRGKGDGWCAFHCFWFLLAATKDGGVEPFVARIQEGVRRNTLRDTVLANLRELAETQHIVDP